MDSKEIIRQQISMVENEIMGIYRARVVHELKIEDAKVSLGDKEVDEGLAKAATMSSQVISMQERMLTVRNDKLAELQAELASLEAKKE